MLTVLEILLTAVAYRRGWKTKALLPLGMSLVVAFLMGIALGAGGGSLERAIPAFFLIDILCLTSLIVLCARSPRQQPV